MAGALAAAGALPIAAGSAIAAENSRGAGGAEAGQAARSAAAAPPLRTQARSQPPLALTVTSVSPSYATPGHPITLKGRVWNGTRSTMRNLSLRLFFSNFAFGSVSALENFAAGTAVGQVPLGIAPRTIGKLRAEHGVAWKITLPIGALQLNCFGVYPLSVRVSDTTGTLMASDPVPLPFWPSKPNSCPQAMRPSPFLISWIWPLIDSPHQGPCPGLLDNTLAASLGPNGRLEDLLSVGASYAGTAHLTWAIDPALLDNARTMTRPYQVGTSADCTDAAQHGADPNAGRWLAKLSNATAGHAVFVTPYADVDVTGLAQYGVTDLRRSFTSGEQLAGPLLGRAPVAAQLPAGSGKLSAVAWPPGGQASQAVLESLGAKRIGAVILAMPPPQQTPTPSAVTSVVDGVGTRLKVLLADYSLSGLLSSAAANSRDPGTMFSVSQLFTAETAMIVAEAPSIQRPIVVTPPRRWDPASTLAKYLLNDTVSAPWLRPVPIGKLAAQPEQPLPRNSPPLAPTYVRAALPGSVLRQIDSLDNSISLLQSIMTVRSSRLNHAVYGIESSVWAGDGTGQAAAMLTRARQFVAKQFAGLSVGGRHVIHVTLGGRVGSVTVSIHNSLSYAVQVALRVTSSNDTVVATQKNPRGIYVVQAHSVGELKLGINATQTGKATLKLSLKSPNGTLLPDKPLIMTISATNLGTVALIICAAALAVFVAVSAAQAIRRGRPGTGEPPAAAPDPAEPDPPSAGGSSPWATTSQSGPAGAAEAEEPAGPGQAQARPRGARDQPTAPELTDSVFIDRSELSSVGKPSADDGVGNGGRRPTEESR